MTTSIVFAPLPSVFLAVVSAAACVGSARAALAEARGKNMAYSKFSPSGPARGGGEQVRLPSRIGMLLVYTPALAAAAAAAAAFDLAVGGRCGLLCVALFLHFLKRDLEISGLMGFLYSAPASVFINAMSVIHCTSLAFIGLSEVAGKHLGYSKFWDANRSSAPAGGGGAQVRISSRGGMLFLYTPALAGAAAAFVIPGVATGERSFLVALAVALHYIKRDLEVLFVHQYSGHMILNSAIPISFSYLMSSICIIYAQFLSQGETEPAVDLKYVGLVVFLVGTLGNFYHHFLLSKLRKKGEKGYKIPQGGLFGLVICPHYLFEVIAWFGVALMSQTLYALSFAVGSTFYLLGRSYATRRWYLSKFENFPKQVKAMIPFLF